jgi:chromosome partitioning protein
MITVIGGIKGGTGKTTLATNLAVIATHFGKNVLLIDADDQNSALDWYAQRDLKRMKRMINSQKAPIPIRTIGLRGAKIHREIEREMIGVDHIFIDAGGRDTISQRSVLTCANVYLLPFRPRSLDIWTIDKVRDLVIEAKVINPNLRIFACINQGDARGDDNEAAHHILKEELSFACLKTKIGSRKAFPHAISEGLGVWEKYDKVAKQEIKSLYSEIYESH